MTYNFDALFVNGEITLGSLSNAAGIGSSFRCDVEQEVGEGRLRSPDDWDWIHFYNDDGELACRRDRGGNRRAMRIERGDLLAWIANYPAEAERHLGADFMQQIITRLK